MLCIKTHIGISTNHKSFSKASIQNFKLREQIVRKYLKDLDILRGLHI